MKVLLSDYFRSKTTAKKTVTLCYAFSSIVFWLGITLYYEYRRYGYITGRGAIVSGNDALITVVATVSLAIVAFLFAVYATVMYLFFAKRSDFTKVPDLPDALICSSCERAFSRDEVSNFVCPVCSGHLESVKGFYKRNPECKETGR